MTTGKIVSLDAARESQDAARVLVIEDDELVRETLESVFDRAGYRVAAVENGVAGTEWLKLNAADVVVTDIYMPEKEGIETIMQIRRDHPAIKIVAISGGGESGLLTVLSFAEKLGAKRVLRKPFAPADIIAAVEEVLNDR